jgi:hypothetical protein
LDAISEQKVHTAGTRKLRVLALLFQRQYGTLEKQSNFQAPLPKAKPGLLVRAACFLRELFVPHRAYFPATAQGSKCVVSDSLQTFTILPARIHSRVGMPSGMRSRRGYFE